ncbi:hypothetical protein RP20_CCG001353 [Aedes albopictus]|nr:hypothetical protein RP20_CCG001353 [Aedes albopictus]
MKIVIAATFLTGLLLRISVTAEDSACKNGSPVNKSLWDCCSMPNLINQDIRADCHQKYGEQTMKQMKLEGTPRGCNRVWKSYFVELGIQRKKLTVTVRELTVGLIEDLLWKIKWIPETLARHDVDDGLLAIRIDVQPLQLLFDDHQTNR